jgi:hypothetical protein
LEEGSSASRAVRSVACRQARGCGCVWLYCMWVGGLVGGRRGGRGGRMEGCGGS